MLPSLSYDSEGVNFNSIKVRLELRDWADASEGKSNFNSIKVRLELSESYQPPNAKVISIP